jgi:hypothetical protein
LYAFVKEEVQNQSYDAASTILLDNILTEDDLVDEECLMETLNDLRELGERYDDVSNIAASGNSVEVTYSGDGTLEKKL